MYITVRIARYRAGAFFGIIAGPSFVHCDGGDGMKRTAQSLGAGAALLLGAAVAVKLIGALFKIPLTNWIGGEGMGYYMTAYSVFNPVYAVSVAGFPAAIARVSAQRSAGRREFSDAFLLQNAFLTFVPLGLLLGILLVLLADSAAVLVGNPDAGPAIRAIAPAVLFCCMTAVLRGSFEGRGDMRPTAFSQCAEAFVKLIAGLLLVSLCLKGENHPGGVSLACAALTGVTLSTAAGFLCAASFYRSENVSAFSKPGHRISGRALRRRLLKTALPICLAALVTNLTTVVDLVTVMNRLTAALLADADAVLSSHPGACLSEMRLADVPNFLFGSYTALAMTVFHLVPALTAPICTGALPFVCALRTQGHTRSARIAVSAVLKASALLAVPAGLGIAALGEPILTLLFPHNIREVAAAAGILRPLGFAAVFTAMACPVNSLLQAVGRPYVPVRLLLCGALLKLAANWFLMGLPGVNIDGAAWGTLLCYGLLMIKGMSVLLRDTASPVNPIGIFIRPAVGGALCAAAARIFLMKVGETLPLMAALPVSIAAGGAVYLLFLRLTVPLSQEEIDILLSKPQKS